jgi:hypothetical protein
MRVEKARAARVLFGIGLVAAYAAYAGPDAVLAAAGKVPRPPATLHVLLTVAPRLPEVARAELITEATAVWHRAGVNLEWIAGTDGSLAPGRMLRVLVIPRHPGAPESPERFVLGELLSFGRPGALAIASINRAEELIGPPRPAGVLPTWLHQGRLGMVLGRAVAHEIGHYLLNTRTHAPYGLMRANFETSALLDHRSGAFDLDPGATSWLQDRIDRGMPIGPQAETWAWPGDDLD